MSSQKIGAGHASAWFRAGLKEIGQALPAFPGSIRVVEEAGLAGNPVPQEIFQDKGKESPYEEWLAARSQEPAKSQAERLDAGLER